MVAELGVESSVVESCGSDVGDVLAVELEESGDLVFRVALYLCSL